MSCFKKPKALKGMFKKKTTTSSSATLKNGNSTTITSTSKTIVETSTVHKTISDSNQKLNILLEELNKTGTNSTPKIKWLDDKGPKLPASPTRASAGAGSRYSPGNEVRAEKSPEKESGGRKIFGGLPSGKSPFKEIPPPGQEENAPEIKQEGVQDYYKIKAECLEKGILFEDDQFPAVDASVFYSASAKREIVWRRPKEICENPRFFVGVASRFDVNQGELGNCWFLAAVANLTMYESLLYQVVPKDNSFVEDYTGAFHFRFWRFGRWVDVVVDDRIPCNKQGKMVYMHSEEENEFWSALLEKAYAKVHGSYEALVGGLSSEALQDFSGGIVEIVDIKSYKLDLFSLMDKAQARKSFMGCAQKANPKVLEERGETGLVRGHAYSITRVQKVDVSTPRKSGKIPLVRIRNPWGNEFEWKGAWADGSREWQLVSEEEKKNLGLTFEDDGEFWMSMKDFQEHYDTLEIVNLSPDSLTQEEKDAQAMLWHTSFFEGAWTPGATAGGCTNHISLKAPKTFADNPQYIVEFDAGDADGDPDKCTLLIALMQKNRRSKRKEGVKALSIGFTIYELKPKPNEVFPCPLDTKFFMYHRRAGDSGAYIDMREVSARIELPPGRYCIIPSSFSPNEDGEFLIRVFSESPNKLIENSGDVGFGGVNEEIEKHTKTEGDASNSILQELFKAVAGEDQEIGWAKLKRLLDSYLKKEFEFDGFSREVCRSMVAMVDLDRTGKLGLDEFTDLWTNILRWKTCFRIYDEDNSGNLSAFELRRALNSAGYLVNNRILESLVMRFGDDEGNISFEDFIMAAVKLKGMIELYKEKDPEKKNSVVFSLEEWVEKTVYS